MIKGDPFSDNEAMERVMDSAGATKANGALIQAPPPPMEVMSFHERMIAKALDNPQIGVDTLEKLYELQERARAADAKRAFAGAVAAAKAEIGPIAKRRTVDFTSTKGRTNYKFEDMALVAEVVDPVISKQGLSYRYRTKQENGRLHVACVLAHRDGYEEETWLSAAHDESGNKNAIQAVASTATYLQRYTLKLALGLAAGPDADGATPAAPAETIGARQIEELTELVESVDGTTKAFCQNFKIEKIGDLPAKRFDEAMKAVKKRMKVLSGDA